MTPDRDRLLALLATLLIGVGAAWYFLGSPVPVVHATELDQPLPEFPAQAEWLNSPPLKLADLKGQVTLIDVWTFECWNCYRSFPWLTAMEARLPKDSFRIIGVHSPEFEREKVAESVRQKAAEFGLHHPILLDPELAYWQALDNHYWPTYYLVDKRGRIRSRYVGETHADTPQAKQIEARVRELLAESADAS